MIKLANLPGPTKAQSADHLALALDGIAEAIQGAKIAAARRDVTGALGAVNKIGAIVEAVVAAVRQLAKGDAEAEAVSVDEIRRRIDRILGRLADHDREADKIAARRKHQEADAAEAAEAGGTAGEPLAESELEGATAPDMG